MILGSYNSDFSRTVHFKMVACQLLSSGNLIHCCRSLSVMNLIKHSVFLVDINQKVRKKIIICFKFFPVTLLIIFKFVFTML